MTLKRSGNVLVAILVIFVCIFGPSAPARSAGSASGSDPSAAVWIGGAKGLVKISASSGTVLAQISGATDVRFIAMDDARARVWISSGRTIACFGFDGSKISSFTLPDEHQRRHGWDWWGWWRDKDRKHAIRPVGPNSGKHAILAVDPKDGSLWLATGKELYRFNVNGTVQASATLSRPAVSIAIDPTRSDLWVATQDGIESFDADANNVLSVRLGRYREVKSIAFDAPIDALWVGTESRVLRYSGKTGAMELGVRSRRIRHIAPDGAGGAWIVSDNRIERLDNSGKVLFEVNPCRDRGRGRERDRGRGCGAIQSIVPDQVDSSLWVLGQRGLARVSLEGEVLSIQKLSALLHGAIRAMGFSRDTISPTLSITSPAELSDTNISTPTLSFNWSDNTNGAGVDGSSLTVTANGSALDLSCTAGDAGTTCTPASPMADGSYNLSATVKDLAGNLSQAAMVGFTIDTIPPAIIITSPKDDLLTNQSSQTITGSLSEPGTLSINGKAVTLDTANGFSDPVTLTEGANTFSFSAVDRAGNTGAASLTLTLDDVPPAAVNTSDVTVNLSGNTATITGSAGSAEPGATVMVTDGNTGQTATATVASDGSFSVPIAALGGDILSITLTDEAGNVSKIAAVSVPAGLPPDPSTVAPTLDPTTTTSMQSATSFLYTGSNPIQTGVASGTIAAQRAAVVRGKVMGKDGNPLSGVTVTILNHPEFGQTLTRADGMFDMAVNGGGQLTADYEKSGYLSSQRQVNVPWRDYAVAPDIVMIQESPKVSAIDLSAATPIQVARGSTVTDSSGTRTATLFFSQGTAATMTMADGSTQPLTSLHVRTTEYTVGANGPEAMPATLPPTSAYTYCEEVSVDEAQAAGATEVSFSSPVVEYLENFLGFPAGTHVPVGYYDGTKGMWVPSDDGRVVKILSITNGMADLDVDGSGQAASASALSALGITDAERAELANLYSSGHSLWRVAMSHFCKIDFNFCWGLLNGDVAYSMFPKFPTVPDKVCKQCGSIIGCESQTLGEKIPVAGTALTLHYQSDRESGHTIDNSIEIPLTGDSSPANLKGVKLIVTVAGRRFESSYPATPDQKTTFTWDGYDAYGRLAQGAQPVTIQLGYTYQAVYCGSPSGAKQSFAAASGVPITLTGSDQSNHILARTDITLWQTFNETLGGWDAKGFGLGGWTVDIHHFYDSSAKKLYLGDGSQRSAQGMGIINIISTVAGGGRHIGDGGPATQAEIAQSKGVAVGPDGSIYISDVYNHRIRKVDPKGIISTVAGNGTESYSGDGGLATKAELYLASGVAVGPDGSIYFADTNNGRVRKVDSSGIISTVAGNGILGYSGDGGPAKQAEIFFPEDVAVGPDGSIYFADMGNNRIRKVDPSGIISTVAGNGTRGYGGDGGPATKAKLSQPTGVAVGPDGGIYIADYYNRRIRKVDSSGIISTVAGNGTWDGCWCRSGDGGPATQAEIDYSQSVAVGPDGSIYITDCYNNRIRKVDPSGIMSTVAGNGGSHYSGDGGPAMQAEMNWPLGVAVGPDGGIYIAVDNRIRRVATALPNFSLGDILIPSEDGSEVYRFDGSGKHLSTLNATTGAVLYQFGYDSLGHLSTITDGSGNVVTIEHDSEGNPTAIDPPFGQQTTLSVDANGYLSSITDPAGDENDFVYTSGGLMTSMTDPNGNTHQFTYDAYGRLANDTNPAGGSKTLARTDTSSGYSVAVTTGMGRVTHYAVNDLSTGATKRIVTAPDGTKTDEIDGTDASKKTTSADGMVDNLLQGPDPRFGMLAEIPTSDMTTTPGGLKRTTGTSRSVTLSDPTNLFSLTGETDTVSVNGRKYTRTFNASTGTFTTTSPAGRTGTSTIDTLGKVVSSQVSGLAPAAYTYDANGRLSTVTAGTDADARTVSLAYNSAGYLSTVTDPLGRTLSFQYDDAGRVTSKTLPDGSVVSFQYDNNGNLIAITPPGRPPHIFTYTAINQNASYTPPDVGSTSAETRYNYNIDGQLTQITRPDGETLDYGYDTAGKLSSLTLPTGSITYGYDASTGNLNQITTSGGTGLSLTYDGSLPTGQSWSGPVSGSVGYTHDNDFRVSAISVDGTNPVSYQYDADSLLTGAGDMTLSRSSQNGLLTGAALGNLTDAWTYDEFGETATYAASSGGNALYSAQYTRDALGRITEKKETINGTTNTFDYAYDQAGRLDQVTENGTVVSTYSYDANGNRRTSTTGSGGTVTGTYDSQDRLLQYVGTSYTYTTNGELQTKTDGNGTTTYQYDVLGNLVHVTLPDGTKVDYIIDGASRRIGKRVNGTLVQGFLYQDGVRPVAELDGNDNVVSRFVYAGGNTPAYMIKGGVEYRIITDQLGSPRLVVNAATGAVVQEMDYDEFGKVINDTNPGFQPFGFASGLYDRDTGLTRFGARDYDAITGRWTVKDPILFAGGDTDLYGYCLNDPVNFIDPNGHWLVTMVIGGISGAIGGFNAGLISGHSLTAAILGGLVGGGVGAAIGLATPPVLGYFGVSLGDAAADAVGSIVGGLVGGAAGGAASSIACTGHISWTSVGEGALAGGFSGAVAAPGIGAAALATGGSELAEGLMGASGTIMGDTAGAAAEKIRDKNSY